MRKYIAALFIIGLVLTGCGAQQGAAKQTAGTPAAVPTEGDSPYDTNGPPASEETTPPPVAPSIARIGATEWFTYQNGLKVQVTKVARFKIGEYASGGNPGDPGVAVTVTIRNGTARTIDVSLTTVNLAYGANGNLAETVYDTNYGNGFEGSVTPGKAKTARFAFAVPAGRQVIDIEVEPGFMDYEASHFEGTVK